MNVSKLLLTLLIIAVGFYSCKEDEPAGPKCTFSPSGINVGYYRAYGVGGGIETCQYAEAETWRGADSHFPGQASGYLFRLRTNVNRVFPSCGELWIKIYSSAAFVTGKRYNAVGWVQESGACHTPNITGWVEFSEYDETNQNVSGRFDLGDANSRTKRLDAIENAVFQNVALSVLN